MNALDALYSRQVPTRSSGGGSSPVADLPEGNAFAAKDSFASALSGEYRKQRHGTTGEDEQELKGNRATPDDAASEPSVEGDGDPVLAAVDPVLAAVYDFHFGEYGHAESGSDETGSAAHPGSKTGTSFETNGYFDSDLAALTDIKSSITAIPLAGSSGAIEPTVEMLQGNAIDIDGLKADSSEDPNKANNANAVIGQNVAADAALLPIAGKSKVDAEAGGAAQVASDPRSAQILGRKSATDTAIVQQRGEVSTNRAVLVDHGLRAKPAADIRKDTNGVSTGNSPAEPDNDTQELRIDQGRERSGNAKAARSDIDASIDKVRVIERRTIAAPQASQNGETVAKALVHDAAQFAQSTRSEAVRPNAATPLPSATNAQAVAQISAPKTLHTLSIQLNPHSLGEVTAVLRMTGDELSVELKVQTAEAYRQLKEDSSAIAKALRAQGYGVETISVQHMPQDRQAMAAQLGQQPNANGQQFQFQEGNERSASGSQNEASRQQSQGGRGGNQSGEGNHEHQSPSADGMRRSDGVYL